MASSPARPHLPRPDLCSHGSWVSLPRLPPGTSCSTDLRVFLLHCCSSWARVQAQQRQTWATAGGRLSPPPAWPGVSWDLPQPPPWSPNPHLVPQPSFFTAARGVSPKYRLTVTLAGSKLCHGSPVPQDQVRTRNLGLRPLQAAALEDSVIRSPLLPASCSKDGPLPGLCSLSPSPLPVLNPLWACLLLEALSEKPHPGVQRGSRGFWSGSQPPVGRTGCHLT